MNDQLDIAKHPFGLAGGIILSGSVKIKGEGFVYYPIQEASASLKIPNLTNGQNLTTTFAAGLAVYGAITEVTQSSGIAILYSGSSEIPRY
jgi:hypothetical protein